MKFLLRFSLLLGCVYFFHFSSFAQPNFLATGLSSSWQYYALTDLGNVRQVTVSAGCVGGNCNEWAFLVNNNFGTCGAPSCAVWRPYNTGSSAVPFNSVIVPNSGSNYGALYNNGSSGGNQGNAGYFSSPTVSRHYTFNITENATSDNTFEILETTYFPANLTGANTTTTGGNISITGLPTLSSGENLFLRYSSSPTMATSTLLELTPAAGSASVNLPVNCSGTTVYYYFYTSSKTSGSILADVGTYGEIAHELSALRVLMPSLGSYYSFSYGGPVVVTSSAGTSTTSTAYADLGAAATAINGTTHDGVITVDINGTHPTVTSTITFTHDANNTSILIRPSCGATRTISGNIAGQFIYLNGADNVTIDGLNTGGNGLVIENTNNTNTANTCTIQLNNDAIGCAIQNCEIRGSSLVTTAQGVISVLASVGTIGCDNTTIQNNKITRAGTNYPTNGIVLAGATTATLNDISILNNEIYDFFNAGADCAGVRANGNTVGVTISGNHFYETQPLTFAVSGSIVFAPIHFTSTANTDNITITNNFIGGSAINCGGTALTINNSSNVVRVIKVSTSIAPSIGASIQGNVIRNMSITSLSSSNAHTAISLVTGKFKIGNITGNTIGSTSAATGINFTTNSTNSGVSFAGISCGSGTVDTTIIKNNTINNLTASGVTTSQLKLRGINATGTGYYQIDNNTIKNLSNSVAVSTSAVSGITFAGTTVGTNTISQNQVTDLSASGGAAVVGIETGTGANPTLTIHENTVKRLVNTSTSTVTGIAFSFVNTTSTQSITNNTVDSLVNLAGTATTGISFGGAGQSNVFTNNIAKRLLASSGTITGMSYATSGANHTINNNLIDSLITNNTATSITGLSISGNTASANTVSTNTIKRVVANTGNIIGLSFTCAAASANHNIANNVIDSLVIKATAATLYGLSVTNFAAVATTSTFSNNTIRKLYATSGAIEGIRIFGSTNVTHNLTNNLLHTFVLDNTTASSAVRGIYSNHATGGIITISGNTIRDIASGYTGASTVDITGIYHFLSGSAVGQSAVIANNLVHSLEQTNPAGGSCNVVGIYSLMSTTVPATTTIRANVVHSLNAASTTTSTQLRGIQTSATTTANQAVFNNMIRLGIDKNGNSITTGYAINGIGETSNGINTFSHNTVFIGGQNVVAANPTSAFASVMLGSTTSVRNNIFANLRSNATSSPSAKHTPVALSFASGMTLDNNLYYAPNTDGAVGQLTGTYYYTLCDWRNITGKEANAVYGDPNFIAPTANVTGVDLHLQSPTAAEAKGTNVGISGDIDGDARNATTPDLGADEGAFTVFNYVVSINLDSVNSICEGNINFPITYNTPVGSPNKYSLTSSDMAGFVAITDAALPASPITATIPSAISAGVYHFTLTVKNYEYCVSATYLFTLTIVAQPSLTITNPAAVCAPNTVNLTATTVTAGSTLPSGTTLSYWTNMAATTPLVNPNAVTTSGTYYIKATKGICSDIEPVMVTINPSPVLSITDPLPICAPNTVDLTDASVTSGSTLPAGTTLTYWTNSGATTVLSNPSAVATGGIYYIKATSLSGCFDIEPVTVTIDPTPNLIITNPSAVCSPNTVDITVSAVTAGSTLNGGTLSYWTNSIATTSLSNPSTVAPGGIYYIKAETAAGCVDIKPITVTINTSPATPSTSDKCAYGASLTLSATGSGGTLQWYNANATSGSVLATGSTYNATTSGTYYVFEQNGIGCYSAGAPAVATLRTGASTNIPTAVGNYWATDIVQEGTWTHYCHCADDYRILSLELNGQNIGTNLAQNMVSQGNASNEYAVRLHIAAGTSIHVPNTVPYVDLSLAPLGWWLIPRAWDVFPHTQPTSAVGIRSYYTGADYNNLNTDISNGGATPLISHAQLTMYKLQNLEAAPNLDAAHTGITQPQIKLYANWTYYTPWTPGNLAPTNPNVYYGEYAVPSFSGGGGGGGSQGTPPLPIILLSFTGKPEGSHNILTWVTSSELNAAHFEVEHSVDGISFEKMGQVKAKGFSTENTTYTFTDKFPYQDKNLYRLKMMDNDGAFKYSNLVEISNKLNFGVTLYPNPVKDKLQLTLSGVEGLFTFKLYNSVGQLVMQEKITHNVDNTEIISLKNLAKGAYLYQITYKGETINGKLLIEE